MRRAGRLLAAVILAVAGTSLAACDGSNGNGAKAVPITTVPPPYDYDYTIPLGTKDRINAGQQVSIMPEVLEAKLGQTIRIVNLDNQSHEVGAWYVLAGSTLTYRFNAVGTFTGVCTTHSSGTFTLKVSA